MTATYRTTREDQLLPLMIAFGRLMRAEMAKHLGPFSMLHLQTLQYVAETGNPSMREVAAYLKVSAPSATEIINALVKDQFLTRARDPEDRRKVRLVVSSAGTRAIKRAEVQKAKAFAAVIAPLSSRERDAFITILTTITTPSS
ncbi:MAG TPA: MarR family transcriptional regulator [Candidatus Paceibacterota bacterium]|nr:MarR family transcriptional regulator [Candidatus Paceibacterota bacterium]